MNGQPLPIVIAPVLGKGAQDTHRAQMGNGLPLEQTWLAKATVDVGKLLEHWYAASSDDGIRYAKATQWAHWAEEKESTLAEKFPQITHSQGREWLRAGGGLCQTKDGTPAVWYHLPGFASREDALAQLRRDHDALIDALDNGLLQMVDAAENLGHGCSALGYGRA